MNSTTTPWGWRLVVMAGMMPAVSGMVGFCLFLLSASSGQEDPWLSMMGRHPFSADDLDRWNPAFYSLWKLVNHLAGVNLAATGVTISWLGWAGLRAGHSWTRPMIAALLLWVGGNDIYALLRFRAETGQGFPFAAIPVVLGTAGLWLHGKGMGKEMRHERDPIPR